MCEPKILLRFRLTTCPGCGNIISASATFSSHCRINCSFVYSKKCCKMQHWLYLAQMYMMYQFSSEEFSSVLVIYAISTATLAEFKCKCKMVIIFMINKHDYVKIVCIVCNIPVFVIDNCLEIV